MLTHCCHVGAEAAEDDGEPFEEKMRRLVTTSEVKIRDNLKRLGYGHA